MCLAIPGKVLSTFDQNGLRMARVQFGGIVREACLEYVPETATGEYVLVHVGFAISRVDEAEAERTYQALKDLDQLTELEAPVVEEIEHATQKGREEEAPGVPAWITAEGVRR
jgi:hydrogenase expression/formation protein HypC